MNRSEIAKKAWRTRRRRAKPSPVMRKWLEWLNARPERVVVAHWSTPIGTTWSFGVYPEMTPTVGHAPHFTRKTFFAMRKRGWVKQIHRTPEWESGSSWDSKGNKTIHYSHRVFYAISDKGKKSLEDQKS